MGGVVIFAIILIESPNHKLIAATRLQTGDGLRGGGFSDINFLYCFSGPAVLNVERIAGVGSFTGFH